MSGKLKPCPFCGSSLIKIKKLAQYDSKKAGIYYIQCSVCSSQSALFKKRRDAIQIWNTRAYEQEKQS